METTKCPFARRAARASAACAIVAVVLFAAPFAGRLFPSDMPQVYRATLYTLSALGVCLCLLLAFALGFIGLAGMKRHGRPGILAPACLGLLLSTLMMIPILHGLSASLKAQARESQIPSATTTNRLR